MDWCEEWERGGELQRYRMFDGGGDGIAERFCDVGFPSVCCEYVLLLLANKEAASAYVRAE